MGQINCARPLPPVAPQIYHARTALGPSARFAECTAEKCCRRGNVWADVLRAAIVPRCPALLHQFAVEICFRSIRCVRRSLRRNKFGGMRGQIGHTRQLSRSPRVAPSSCYLNYIPGPGVMFIGASRSLLFGVTRRNNIFIEFGFIQYMLTIHLF